MSIDAQLSLFDPAGEVWHTMGPCKSGRPTDHSACPGRYRGCTWAGFGKKPKDAPIHMCDCTCHDTTNRRI